MLDHTRILVFGTFDILHEGHVDFFQQARALAPNPYLMVSIARDTNVARIKQVSPHFLETQRLAAVQGLALVDEAMLGAVEDYLAHIVELRPDIIALGYDQVHYTDGLADKLRERGLDVRIKRLESFHPERYKSSIIKKQFGIK